MSFFSLFLVLFNANSHYRFAKLQLRQKKVLNQNYCFYASVKFLIFTESTPLFSSISSSAIGVISPTYLCVVWTVKDSNIKDNGFVAMFIGINGTTFVRQCIWKYRQVRQTISQDLRAYIVWRKWSLFLRVTFDLKPF